MEMRPMKFRAWVSAEYIGEDQGIMHTAEDDQDFFLVGSAKGFGLVDGNHDYVPENHFMVMQWTGLMDKNGTDIYEGDILQPKPGKHDRLWSDQVGRLHVVKDIRHPFGNARLFEVIGNIYANPELLTS